MLLSDSTFFFPVSLVGFHAWLLGKSASLLTNGDKKYSQQIEGHPISVGRLNSAGSTVNNCFRVRSNGKNKYILCH